MVFIVHYSKLLKGYFAPTRLKFQKEWNQNGRAFVVLSAAACGIGDDTHSILLRAFSTVLQDSVHPYSHLVTTSSSPSSQSDIPTCSQPLGAALPTDEHACSVSLPTWKDVVGYEEGNVRVTSAMNTGYPRFVYHPYVVQLMNWVVEHYSKDIPYQQDCLLLPTEDAAERCLTFLQKALESKTNVQDNALISRFLTTTASLQQQVPHVTMKDTRIRRVRIETSNNGPSVHAVLFPAETMAGSEAKAYWQHTGEVVSSRRAERALSDLQIPIQRRVTVCPIKQNTPHVLHSAFPQSNITVSSSSSSSPAAVAAESQQKYKCDFGYNPHLELQTRIAHWARVPGPEHVFLTTSGMAAIYTALRSSRRYQMSVNQCTAGGTSIVFGFPYLDTLKVCSRQEFCPSGVEFFGRGNERDLQKLEQFLQKSQSQGNQNKICALFTEVPSNPLLQCPDMYRLRQLADEYDFALVVDDTISNFLNVNVLESGLADAVCTSLTKIVSGRGDAIAGSVVTNPHTPRGRWMQQDLATPSNNPSDALYCQDAHAILCNSTDFVERNARINHTAQALADWLVNHIDVETVYYPKLTTPVLYERVRRHDSSDAGYGGLMSMILNPHVCQRSFYDALDVSKGPSLGTNFTLVCPYTLLAHYHELDFAMSYAVPPNLLRIAVGLEPFHVLQEKFEAALRESRLYPKPTVPLELCDGDSVKGGNASV